ncbi:MAG: beta-lactamase family protein [Spirochaetia bacterium]|nr:beta-lactamase family protein [Spirochaetia bacterium]
MGRQIMELEQLIRTEYADIVGIVVHKNGKRIYESYFDGFNTTDTVHVMSVTKSIVSALVGIAIDKGYIESVDQKVIDFFPGYKPKRGERTIQDVTIRHMLTMTAPYKYRSEPYTKVYASTDWTKAALDLLGGKSGITGKFRYSTIGTQILSGILTNATGKPVIDFATAYLFAPLDIKAPHNTVIHSKEEHIAFLNRRHASGWVVDPKGVHTAGWGLCLTPRDMAKFGQLYANGGLYGDRQILSSNWIEESTSEKSQWEKFPYGYLWWIIDCNGNHCYAAIGDGGNIIFVNPRKDMAVAIASRFTISSKAQIEQVLALITGHIVPLFG